MQEKSFMNQIYSNIKAKIRPYWVTAFVSCMVIGLLTYGYLMSNHFLTHDSMWNLYSDQNMITSGRQFLQFACGISSYYDLPWFNGLLAIFYLAITSVLVVEGLGIRSHVCVFHDCAVSDGDVSSLSTPLYPASFNDSANLLS